MTREDRELGCLLGLFIGDALGAAVEFSQPGTFEPVTGYRSGIHSLQPGQWTDDGSMAMACMGGIVEAGRWDMRQIIREWLSWYRNGKYSCTGVCFDIGTSTRQAMTNYLREGLASTLLGCTSGKGNGVLMRLAPAVLFTLRDSPSSLRSRIESYTVATHNTAEARYTARVMTELLANRIHGGLPKNWGSGPWSLSREWTQELSNKWGQDIPPSSSGYCFDTLSLAGWALNQTIQQRLTPAAALLTVVNQGLDSDTNAAVAGQLLGAHWGTEWIPQTWVDQLYNMPGIIKLFHKMMKLAGRKA